MSRAATSHVWSCTDGGNPRPLRKARVSFLSQVAPSISAVPPLGVRALRRAIRPLAVRVCHGPTDVLMPLTPWLCGARALSHAMLACGFGLAAAASLAGAIVPLAWLTRPFVLGLFVALGGFLGRLMVGVWQPTAVSPPRRT